MERAASWAAGAHSGAGSSETLSKLWQKVKGKERARVVVNSWAQERRGKSHF